MKIIQHRCNLPFLPLKMLGIQPEYVEIDVHIDNRGNVVIKHNPDDDSYPVNGFNSYLGCMQGIKGFLVDIKQNLPVEYLERIVKAFGSRLLGLIDVPWPSVYYARQAGLDVIGRVSEYEQPNRIFDRFWLDPLESWTCDEYMDLLDDIQCDTGGSAIIAAPSLHGGTEQHDVFLMEKLIEHDDDGVIEGIVTKYPKVISELVNA